MTTVAFTAASAKSHKLWGGRFSGGPAPEFDALNNSIGIDFRLWPFDIQLSKAWAMALYKGSTAVVGRESVHALYDERFVTFGEDDVYQQSDAAGFIRLFALPSRVRAIKDQELAAPHPSGNGTSPALDAESAPAAAGELAAV